MESMMQALVTDQFAEELRERNLRMGFLVDNLIPHQTGSCLPGRAANPPQISDLLSELMGAGEWLRSLPHDRSPELEQELTEYRRNVQRLRALMPGIHAALLQERAQLEAERGRVEAATEWARRSRQTL
jgi:hypothetical protein